MIYSQHVFWLVSSVDAEIISLTLIRNENILFKTPLEKDKKKHFRYAYLLTYRMANGH